MSTSSTPAATAQLDPKRWRALVVIAMAQLMVVLDASILNIALPHTSSKIWASHQLTDSGLSQHTHWHLVVLV